MTSQHERSIVANKLKAAFNVMWEEAIGISDHKDEITYRDISRIADVIKHEGPKILGCRDLPKQIDAVLPYAVAIADPNKQRLSESLKYLFSGVSGVGGIALIAIMLGQLLNPGLWAIVVAFVAGGVAGGPLAVLGIAGGVILVASAVYIAMSKKTPQERSVEIHKVISAAIDNWIKYGSEETGLDEESKMLSKLSDDKHAALVRILWSVIKADGKEKKAEKDLVMSMIGTQHHNDDISMKKALAELRKLSKYDREMIMLMCEEIAFIDNEIKDEEKKILDEISLGLGVGLKIINS